MAKFSQIRRYGIIVTILLLMFLIRFYIAGAFVISSPGVQNLVPSTNAIVMGAAQGDDGIDCSNTVSSTMPLPVSTDLTVSTEAHENGISADCQAKPDLANNFVCGQIKAYVHCSGWWFDFVLCRCGDTDCSEPVLLQISPLPGWDYWVKIFDPVIVLLEDPWCSRDFGGMVHNRLTL